MDFPPSIKQNQITFNGLKGYEDKKAYFYPFYLFRTMRLFNYIILLTAMFYFSGCGLKNQREQLAKMEAALLEKEQELSLKEIELHSLEALLNEKQKQIDSALIQQDTLAKIYPTLPGMWRARMVCTDAGCPGFALGDTKVEQWEISFESNRVVARAMNNKLKLIRIYTGSITQDGLIILKAATQDTDEGESSSSGTTMKVVLKQTKADALQGQRTITQANNCQVAYSLDLKKKD